MKSKLLRIAMMLALVCGFAYGGFAQHFYVKVRPATRVEVRPVAPAKNYIWVSGDWVWTNGAYAWHAGHWVAPPRAHAVWIPGHWVRETRHGYYWVPGHWRY